MINNIKCLSWNVNGLMNRKDILSEYLSRNDIDIALIQEIKCDPQNNIDISGYNKHVLPSKSAQENKYWARGLVTYVKQSIPSKPSQPLNLGDGVEAILINCFDANGKIALKVQNTYVPQKGLKFHSEELSLVTEPLIIAGDLNASIKGKTNKNGRELLSYFNSIDNVLTDADPKCPTHIKGNRLDYILISNMPYADHSNGLASSLLSDHKAVVIDINIPQCELRRKRALRK